MATKRVPDCDVCKHELGEVTPAVYDSKTKMGPRAFLCNDHFESIGVWPNTKLSTK